MRSILTVVSFLCIIIGGFLVISIPFVGIFKVFSLFPSWFYIVVFLGIVIPYMLKEAVNDNSHQNTEQQKQVTLNNTSQPPTKADTIQYKNIEVVTALDSVAAITCLYPHVTSADDAGAIIGVMENTQGKEGFIKLSQQRKKVELSSGKVQILDSRTAYLTGSIEELNEFIEKYGLQIGSQIKGKIILVESLIPSWKGHRAKIGRNGNTVGYSLNGRFYSVYVKYIFVQDANACDDVMNYMKAKYFFKDYDLKPGDILPTHY
jgi:hypothetical protein